MKSLGNLLAAGLTLLMGLSVHATSSKKSQELQPQPVPWDQPAGQIKLKTSAIDFGQTTRGNILNLSFEFTNKGKGPLIIQGIHAPCGCLVVDDLRDKRYEPEESGKINVKVDTSNFEGEFSKSIVIMTSQTKNNTSLLYIKGKIVSEWQVEPPLIDFGQLKHDQANEKFTRKVIIRNKSDLPLAIGDVLFDQHQLQVEMKPQPDHWLLIVQLKKQQDSSFLNTDIWLKNNSRYLPQIRIPVRASFPDKISYQPSYIEFGSLTEGKSVNKQLTLSGMDDFELLNWRFEMYVNGEQISDDTIAKLFGVKVSDREQPKKRVQIELKNPSELKLNGNAYGRVFLSTSLMKKQDIVVDFYAFFGR